MGFRNSKVSLLLGLDIHEPASLQRERELLSRGQTNHILIEETSGLRQYLNTQEFDSLDYTILSGNRSEVISAAAAEVRGLYSWARSLSLIDESKSPEVRLKDLQEAKKQFNAWSIKVIPR